MTILIGFIIIDVIRAHAVDRIDAARNIGALNGQRPGRPGWVKIPRHGS